MNEDFLFIEGNLFGVFDGATSLNDATYKEGRTGGFLASNIAGAVFRRNNASLLRLADRANAAICGAMREAGVDPEDRGGLWSTSAAVARVNQDDFEWAQIGDSLVMVVYDDGSHETPARGFDQDLETLRMWKEASKNAEDSIMTALHEQIVKVRKNMNVTYGTLNGEEKAMRFLNHGRMPLRGVAHILLFTDGLFVPKADPGDRDDFTRFADLYRRGGLACVRDHVRAVEAEDADCRRCPRFKTHDDIAAIAVDLRGAVV